MVYIKPAEGYPGNHVYASNGDWAFDHNGWMKETDLLAHTEEAYTERYPGWSYTRHVIEPELHALETLCKSNNHKLPWQYAHLPWERAYNYIKQFPSSPPS